MFFRVKKSGQRAYVQIVENRRLGGAVRQSVIANLGRAEALIASGALAALLASGAKFPDQVLLLQALEQDDGSLALDAKRIGGPLLFARLWQELGIGEVLDGLLAAREFSFAVERAVFVATLHRLFVSGSDRDCVSWMADYDIGGAEALCWHHFCRAMAWLGEAVEAASEASPRCIKDLIEERLFERRRDLFTDLSVVFMDTTSLSFEGEGGQSLGQYGYSKDLRPDLPQMILGLVMDGAGWPVCTEMGPGNTADVTVLLPIVDRLRHRFGIGRVCVVADRGMISAETIAGLEARGLDYILGAREHSDKLVRQIVLDDRAPFVPLAIDRRQGETQLFVKEVNRAGVRYIVCRNEREAANDRAVREAIVAALDAQLQRGDKALIGNAGYRRYLRKSAAAKGQLAFEIDPGKLAEAARFDGICVLRTNARLTPLQAVLRYRDLVRVEDLFRRAKAVLRTRPIFHSCDAAIRGHVFCSFLALLLQKRLDDLAQTAGVTLEWKMLLRDLDRLQQVRIHHREADWPVRTDASPPLAAVFHCAKIALPPRVKPIAPPPATPPPKPARKRRGRPRRSATAARISPNVA